MLIKALVDYAATAPGLKSQLQDRSVISADVHWLINIDIEGHFLGLVPTAGREVKRGGRSWLCAVAGITRRMTEESSKS
jgi:hypothetical protein